MSETLDRTIVVLDEPQDLVNVALVVRAMKNMGLSRLRLVRPLEYDTHRILGIAHDTEDLVARIELHDELTGALADAGHVIGASARRRSSRQAWLDPEAAAGRIASREDPVALLFGREDRGLSNEELDLCDALVCIPTSPGHPSLNLGHAAVILFYELRKAVEAAEGLDARDLSYKKRRQSPPATHAELEEFFTTWERAMNEIGLFHGIDPVPKMRSFRTLFQRADVDRRELGLLLASAYEIIHFAARESKRARERAEAELGARSDEATGETTATKGSGARRRGPRG